MSCSQNWLINCIILSSSMVLKGWFQNLRAQILVTHMLTAVFVCKDKKGWIRFSKLSMTSPMPISRSCTLWISIILHFQINDFYVYIKCYDVCLYHYVTIKMYIDVHVCIIVYVALSITNQRPLQPCSVYYGLVLLIYKPQLFLEQQYLRNYIQRNQKRWGKKHFH